MLLQENARNVLTHIISMEAVIALRLVLIYHKDVQLPIIKEFVLLVLQPIILTISVTANFCHPIVLKLTVLDYVDNVNQSSMPTPLENVLL